MGFFDNKTVTIFNRVFDPDTEVERYYPTLLGGVDLVETQGANISKSGMESADAAKLYIDATVLYDGEITYIPPDQWKALPEEERQQHFTVTPTEDFFLFGDYIGVELPEEGAYQWMRDTYSGVYKVTTVDKYEDILPHYEIGGV